MVDVTIVGGGTRARDCSDVLSRAGFSLGHAFELEAGTTGPVILGDVQGAYQLAREAMDTGRHLLIASTHALTPERLTQLLQHRRQAQALFVWSDRRHHPGYRFVASLTESDNTWQPRYVRQEVLSTEQATSALFRWQTLEALALLSGITAVEPRSVSATAVHNAKRSAPDLASLVIGYGDIEAQLVVGLGEAVERRETLVASATRKAYVDELNVSMPVRIIDDEPANTSSARSLSYTAPSPAELARQQCVAFLDSTLHSQRTVDEAAVWQRSIAALAAMEQSLTSRTPVDVVMQQDEPRFRVVGDLQTPPPSVA